MAEAQPPPPGFRVDPCGPEQREEQARLHNRCFKKPVDAADLRWRYDESPCGRSLSWVGRVSGGAAVTGYACNPRRAVPAGSEEDAAIVGQTGDVMTDPEWRRRGLFSELDRACQRESASQGWPLVFGLPNRRSAHIFLELGWQDVGRVRPWAHLLAADAAARADRRRDGRLAALLTPLAAGRARRRRAALARLAPELEPRALESFPPEVEELSRAVEPHFALMVRREAAYLDWRFLRSPSGLHRALGLFEPGGRLAAYVVVQAPRAGETTGYLVDLLAPRPEARGRALAAGLELLAGAGASVVAATAMEGSWWEGRLAEAGFVPGREERALSVILCAHRDGHPLVSAARDPARWYFTDGDRDDETMG